MIYPLTAYEINKLTLRQAVLTATINNIEYYNNSLSYDQKASVNTRLKLIELHTELKEITKALSGNK